jgi:hypothetical protein
VREFTTKFRANPTAAAINYEALHGMRDPKVRTVRIDQQYRAVVVHPPSGDLYLLGVGRQPRRGHGVGQGQGVRRPWHHRGDPGGGHAVRRRAAGRGAADARPRPACSPALSDDDLARVGLPTVLVPAVRALASDDRARAAAAVPAA